MKIYAMVLSVCSIVVFSLRFFYFQAVENVSHNLNLLFNSHINGSDAKDVVYFYPLLSILISRFIIYKHVLFKIIYILLIALNILLLIFSLQKF